MVSAHGKNNLGEKEDTYVLVQPENSAESVPAPRTDEEAHEMLRGHVNACAFLTEYDKLRADGMLVEQAMIFVGHHFRMRHLEFQPAR